MDELEVERLLAKASYMYVIAQEPAFIFIYEKLEDAKMAFEALSDVFDEDDIAVHVRYSLYRLNLSIIAENTSKIVNTYDTPFYDPKMFQIIKPMSNKINGTDVTGQKHLDGMSINTGVMFQQGIRTASGKLKTGLGRIVKFGTRLIP